MFESNETHGRARERATQAGLLEMQTLGDTPQEALHLPIIFNRKRKKLVFKSIVISHTSLQFTTPPKSQNDALSSSLHTNSKTAKSKQQINQTTKTKCKTIELKNQVEIIQKKKKKKKKKKKIHTQGATYP